MSRHCSSAYRMVCSLLLSGVFCLGSAQYIKNGDFSLLGANGWPVGWTKGTDSTVVQTGDTVDFHSAPASLKIYAPAVKVDFNREIQQRIVPTPKGETLHMSAWIKEEGTTEGAGFWVYMYVGKAGGKYALGFIYKIGYHTTGPIWGAWHKVEGDYFVDSTAVYAAMTVTLHCAGTAWIDDIVITGPKTPVSLEPVEWRMGGPALDGSTVSFPQSASYSLRVLDLSGRSAASSAGRGRALTVDQSGMAHGAYVVQVRSAVGDVAGKLVWSGQRR